MSQIPEIEHPHQPNGRPSPSHLGIGSYRRITSVPNTKPENRLATRSNGFDIRVRSTCTRAVRAVAEAVQLFGGGGYIKKCSVRKLPPEAEPLQNDEVASDIQRLTIVRELTRRH